ncbi:unnamed protein product [Ranitomeya imitator]|uniref:POP1 C-terminal domain-containing protein n=1 Tax=Ranitomeya imitator TaxID=111125 RepID=A0ABN9KXQ7_9NEOB|nr:unnamed protein product [Ranitomeya imitator]
MVYTRRPPAKRTNFIKHGVLAPFYCPWNPLTGEWQMRLPIGVELSKVKPQIDELETKVKTSPNNEEMEFSAVNAEPETTLEEDTRRDFSVLRSKKILKMLSALVAPVGHGSKRPSDLRSHDLSSLLGSVLSHFPRSLVWVRLSMVTKGSPELHSLICIPSEQDFLNLQKDKSFAGPLEPKHGDHFKKKILKIKKDKKKKKVKTNDKTDRSDATEEPSCSDDLTLGLWPSPLPELTTHCRRLLLGYVTQGDFSMAVGSGEGLGFVSLTGLAHMLSGQPEDKAGLVLIRNLTSLQYRFAKLTVEV